MTILFAIVAAIGLLVLATRLGSSRPMRRTTADGSDSSAMPWFDGGSSDGGSDGSCGDGGGDGGGGSCGDGGGGGGGD